MTRPDVEALAAALLREAQPIDRDQSMKAVAEAIIAALAAAGWRITSAPVIDLGLSPEESDQLIAAVSAQAAPVAPHVWVDDRGVATGGNVLGTAQQGAPVRRNLGTPEARPKVPQDVYIDDLAAILERER